MSAVLTNIEKPCPVCSSTEFAELIDFGLIPQSGIFLSSPKGQYRQIHLAFEYCLTCALIRSRSFDKSCPASDYRKGNRPTQNQEPEYIPEIIRYLSQVPQKNYGLVMDIGGNDGAFMDLVAKAGCQNRLIIEPSISLAKVCRERRHPVENVYFNSCEAERLKNCHGAAKVIFCRHVLEHVPDPEDFFKALLIMTAEEGIVFLETPDARGITEGLLGHELWDEHLFHFTPENLRRLLLNAGFRMVRSVVKPHRGGTNILLWAIPDPTNESLTTFESKVESDLEASRFFSTHWEDMSRRIQWKLEICPKPVACLGASHPQSNYLLFSGVGNHVDFLVDDDQMKVGFYVPVPRPIPVISTDQLLEGPPPGTVVRSAFGCDTWMNEVCRPLAEKGVHIVEPYPNELRGS